MPALVGIGSAPANVVSGSVPKFDPWVTQLCPLLPCEPLGQPFHHLEVDNAPTPCVASQREPASETSSAVSHPVLPNSSLDVPEQTVNSTTGSGETWPPLSDALGGFSSDSALSFGPSSTQIHMETRETVNVETQSFSASRETMYSEDTI